MMIKDIKTEIETGTISVTLLLLCWTANVWGQTNYRELFQDIPRGHSPSGNGGGAPGVSLPAPEQDAQPEIENLNCDTVRSLPMEFFSELVPNGEFNVKFEDNKIVFPPILYPKCLIGSGGSALSPITIGLESSSLQGNYVVTARVNNVGGESIGSTDQLMAKLRHCIEQEYRNEPTINVISIPMTNVDETRPLVWGVAGNTLGLQASSDHPIGDYLKREDDKASCFRTQEISKSAIVYNERDEVFKDNYLGHCENCNETLLDRIRRDPGIEGTARVLRQYAMDLFKQDFAAYLEAMKVEDDPDNLRSARDDFFNKLTEFILGDNGDGSNDDGSTPLITHYRSLLRRMASIAGTDRGSDAYQAMEVERDRIKEFLDLFARGLLDEQGAVRYLMTKHDYIMAKQAQFVGMIMKAVGDERNKNISSKRIISAVKQRHREWERRVLRRHVREWEFNKRKQYARENPKAGTSRIYERRYESAMANYRREHHRNLKWERTTRDRIRYACTNTMPLPFGGGLRMGPFTPGGYRQMNNRCRGLQHRLQSEQLARRHRMQMQQRRAQAFQDQARQIAQAEAAGYRDAIEGGSLFFDDEFAYSDDLYSPMLDDYNVFESRGGRRHQWGLGATGAIPPPRMMPSRNFGHDPSLQLLNNNFTDQYYHGRFLNDHSLRPNMFGSPSYALPPNPYRWGPSSFGPPGRSPAGYFSLPPPPGYRF